MTDRIRTITLHQPWATLIALGVKNIETRSWRAPASAIGERLVIHAAARRPDRGQTGEWFSNDGTELYRVGTTMGAPMHPLPRGAIVATCTLAACVPMVDGPMPRNSKGPPRLVVLPDALWLLHHPEGYATNIEEQRAYGDFQDGRWAWILEDVKPTTERCPVCWGAAGQSVDGGAGVSLCGVCADTGRCDPIPAKGFQRALRWEP